MPADYVNCWQRGQKVNSSWAAGWEEICVDSFVDPATVGPKQLLQWHLWPGLYSVCLTWDELEQYVTTCHRLCSVHFTGYSRLHSRRQRWQHLQSANVAAKRVESVLCVRKMPAAYSEGDCSCISSVPTHKMDVSVSNYAENHFLIL